MVKKKNVCVDACCCKCFGLAILVIGVIWLLKELSVFKTILALPIALIIVGLALKCCCRCK